MLEKQTVVRYVVKCDGCGLTLYRKDDIAPFKHIPYAMSSDEWLYLVKAMHETGWMHNNADTVDAVRCLCPSCAAKVVMDTMNKLGPLEGI